MPLLFESLFNFPVKQLFCKKTQGSHCFLYFNQCVLHFLVSSIQQKDVKIWQKKVNYKWSCPTKSANFVNLFQTLISAPWDAFFWAACLFLPRIYSRHHRVKWSERFLFSPAQSIHLRSNTVLLPKQFLKVVQRLRLTSFHFPSD